jgi:hypothetical protein
MISKESQILHFHLYLEAEKVELIETVSRIEWLPNAKKNWGGGMKRELLTGIGVQFDKRNNF